MCNTVTSLTVEREAKVHSKHPPSLDKTSRDPAAQRLNPHHADPDGAVLYLGTMFPSSRTATPPARA
jgi:fumarylacetoacetate (FAA) hydrolase family protein